MEIVDSRKPFAYANWSFPRTNNVYARPGKKLSDLQKADKKKGIFQGPYIDNAVYAQNSNGYVLSHNSMLENPVYLRDKYLKSKYHQGWRYENVDLDNDGQKDTVVYDASGNPVVWNGYHYVPNSFMLERENFMQDPENEAKYGYSLKKFKHDIKSTFDKLLSDLASNLHKELKTYFTVIPADLSSTNLKTIIKQAYLIPYLIQNGIITKITLQEYINELTSFAQFKKTYPDAKSTEAKSLMALYRRATYILEKLPERDIVAIINNIRKLIVVDNIANICGKYIPIKGANKDMAVIELINSQVNGGIVADNYSI